MSLPRDKANAPVEETICSSSTSTKGSFSMISEPVASLWQPKLASRSCRKVLWNDNEILRRKEPDGRKEKLWSTGEEMIGWFVHKNPHAALRILSTMQAANGKFLQRSHMMFLAVMVSSPPSFKATVTSSDAEILSAGIVQISKHLNFMTSKCLAGSTSLSGFHKSSQLNAVWHWVGSSELSEALQIFHLLTVGSADQTGEVFVYIWSEIYIYNLHMSIYIY